MLKYSGFDKIIRQFNITGLQLLMLNVTDLRNVTGLTHDSSNTLQPHGHHLKRSQNCYFTIVEGFPMSFCVRL